jgi:3-oxoacyl-[acyl-carrier protein] reductase
MYDLNGMNAVVSGASRGIGRAIAVRLSQAGVRVIVHYNSSEEGAQKTLSLLKGFGHYSVQADLSDPMGCEKLARLSIEAFGQINLLVNNAGIYEHMRFDSVDYEEWQARWKEMVETNLLSAVNLSYLFVRHFLEYKTGKIVNISSRTGFKGERQASHYAVTKAAMINFTRSMANELAKTGILSYGVAPGYVETEMTTDYIERDLERIIKDVPLGRVATSEDVANVVVFLASKEANYLNGLVVDVNGGSYFH